MAPGLWLCLTFIAIRIDALRLADGRERGHRAERREFQETSCPEGQLYQVKECHVE